MTALLLFILLIPFVMFIPLSRRAARHSTKTFVDAHIPFLPFMVVPYLGLFVLIPYALMTVVPTQWGTLFLVVLIIAMWSGSLVWYFFPTGMARPKVTGRDLFSRAVRLMYKLDGPCNNFPSSHVFVALLCGHFLAIAQPEYMVVTWIAASLVAASTVFVKQHNALDILGGILWATGSVAIVALLVG